MIKFLRTVIVLGGILVGAGLAGEVYEWYGSNIYFLILAGAFVCGTTAKLIASFVK